MSKTGLEPVQISPHAPQTCASTIPPLRHKWNYSIFKVIYFIFVAEQSLSLLPSPSKATFSCFLVGRVPLRHKWNYSIFKVIYFIFVAEQSLSLLPSPSKATFSCFLVGRVPLRHKWNYSIFKVIYFIFTDGVSSIYKHQILLQINLIMDKKACQIRN